MKRFFSLLTILLLIFVVALSHADEKEKKKAGTKSKSCCSEMASVSKTSGPSAVEETGDVATTEKKTAAEDHDKACGGSAKVKLSKEECEKKCGGMKAEKSVKTKGTVE